MKMPFDKEKIPFLKSERIFIGVCFIILGLFIWGIQKGRIPEEWQNIIFSIPMLVLVMGAYLYYCRKYIISGVFLMLIGGYFPFLMQSDIVIDNVCVDVFKEYWSFLFVLVGVYSLFRCNAKTKKESGESFDLEKRDEKKWKKEIIDDLFVFSEGDHIFLESEFRGGKISTYVGRALLDLRHTSINGKVKLQIKVVLGNIRVLLPSDWKLEIHKKTCFSVFKKQHENLSIGPNVLIIKVSSFLSEVEIK